MINNKAFDESIVLRCWPAEQYKNLQFKFHLFFSMKCFSIKGKAQSSKEIF